MVKKRFPDALAWGQASSSKGELSRPKTDGPNRRRREAEDVSKTRKRFSILCNKVDYDNVGPWD
jgi:hypothetical protein